MVRVCLLFSIVMACGGNSTPPSPAAALSATWNAPAILAHVPADTPYVFGVIDPVDRKLWDQMFTRADRKVAEAVRAVEQLPPDFDRADLEPHMRALFAVFDELRGKDLSRWGTELGFHPSGRFVLYGLSVWPVLRVAIADPARMRALAKRVIAAAGLPVEEGVQAGHAYWLFTAEKAAIIASVLDDEAVIAIVPSSIVRQALPLVLGVRKPARSLRDTTTLPELIGHYNLLSGMVGYADVRAAANIITQRAPSAFAALDQPLVAATGPVSPACRDDVERLVSLVPRIVLGYRRLDKTGLHGRLIFELPPAVTAAIRKLSVAVPGVVPGISGEPLVALGVAARVDEAINLVRRLTKHLADRPFSCPWFDGSGDAFAKLDVALALPMPPAIQTLHGAAFVLEDFQREPLRVSASALIAGDQAHDAVTLVLRRVLGINVHVGPGGAAVQVPIGPLGMPPSLTAHAAGTLGRAAVAVGELSVARVTKLLETAAPARSPLASIAMDSARLRQLGLFDEEDDSMMDFRHVALQLEVIDEGLALEMFGRF